jgi:hypothetical protein
MFFSVTGATLFRTRDDSVDVEYRRSNTDDPEDFEAVVEGMLLALLVEWIVNSDNDVDLCAYLRFFSFENRSSSHFPVDLARAVWRA